MFQKDDSKVPSCFVSLLLSGCLDFAEDCGRWSTMDFNKSKSFLHKILITILSPRHTWTKCRFWSQVPKQFQILHADLTDTWYFRLKLYSFIFFWTSNLDFSRLQHIVNKTLKLKLELVKWLKNAFVRQIFKGNTQGKM